MERFGIFRKSQRGRGVRAFAATVQALCLMALAGQAGAAPSAGPGAASAKASASAASSAAAKVDLNRASEAELATLPGIGAAKAAAIVAHRDKEGAFGSVEDLEAVRGIGPALVGKLRPLVELGASRGKARVKSAAGTPSSIPSGSKVPGKPPRGAQR